mgnify:CR=1 FL=1
MNCKIKFGFLVLLLTIFSFSNKLFAQFRYNPIVINESIDLLQIQLQSPFVSFDTITTSDLSNIYLYPRFELPTKVLSLENGIVLFIAGELIALPDSINFHLSETEIHPIRIFGGKITPAFFNLKHFDNLILNYERDWTGEEWVKLNYLGIGRNIHLGLLQFVVAKYDNTTGTFSIPEKINVKIKFRPTISNFYSDYTISDNEILSDVLNTLQAKQWILPVNYSSKLSKDEYIPLSTNNTFVKIKVDTEGIYKIDASMLSNLGIKITSDLVPTLKLYGNDGKPLSENVANALNNRFNEIPIIVQTKSDGSLDYILFYGVASNGFEFKNGTFRSYHNPYSNSNYYLLGWGGNIGQRIANIPDTLNCSDFKVPEYYIERILFREELTNPFNSGSGRIWFGGSIFPRNFVNFLPDLYRSGEVFYRFYVAQNYVDTVSGYYGKFIFYDGQNKITEALIPKCGSYEEAVAKEVTGKLPANQISSDNRSYLKIEYHYPNQNASSTPYFNYYEIHYPRRFVANDNSISIFSNFDSASCYEIQINGFTGGEIIGLDVTNPLVPFQITNQSIVKNSFIFRFFNVRSSPRKFFVSSNFLKPEISKVSLAGLRNNSLDADVIVVTHKSLLNSATKYKEYREKVSKLKVVVVTTEDIYNEFAYGVPDPTAIRDFVAFAMAKWNVKPKYLVLWGDGHYDFRNISTKQTNYIPAFQLADSYSNFISTISFTSDDYYGCVVGDDDVIDLIVARIPVYDDATGLVYLDKIQIYENSSEKTNWRNTLLFCADDSPQSRQIRDGNQHTKDSEYISNNFVPREFFVKKIYLPEYPTENVPSGRRKPLATAELVRTINEGVLLVNWLGHGNPRVWAHEELFDRDKTISLFTNREKLFFGIAATCDFGRFDMVDLRSGTEELLFYPKGGAIGYLSASRAVYVSDNANLNKHFVDELFKRRVDGKYGPVGKVYFAVKQRLSGFNDMKYMLFGDPLIVLLIPDLISRVDQINSVNMSSFPKDSILKIKAFSVLQIEGRICSNVDSTIVEEFNGNVEVIINDVGYFKKVVDSDGTIHSIYRDGGIIAKGILPVTNGKFRGEFYITDEVSFLDGNISIRLFARDTTRSLFAKGIENRIKISGIDTILSVDNQPPRIEIFLDDTTFIEGDIVSNPPLLIVKLYDNTAINTTGVGIGHLIEAWIDDKPESVNLTDKYESSQINPKEGFVKAFLDKLEPGVHRIRVRAWDIFNNFSIAETKFRVVSSDEGILLFNQNVYPQPAEDYVVFRVQHNLNQNYNVLLKVFNIYGQEIFEGNYDSSRLRSFEIKYNCVDKNGNPIPEGIYLYQIQVSNSYKRAMVNGKFAIVK